MKHCVIALLACLASSLTVSVLSPQSLQQRYSSGIPAEFALFGPIPYGSYSAGKVIRVSSNCCTVCRPTGFNSSVPAVFLLPRGNCAFDTMVHYAEVAGARAVIIYNAYNWQKIDLMESSGYYNVSIPSALLAYDVAQEVLAVSGDIVLNITFESVAQSPEIEVGAVYALKNTFDWQIISLLPSILEFGPNAVLKPYFALLDCPDCNRLRSNPDCICSNQYCSIQHPQGGLVVRESIRQQCIYQQSNTTSYVAYMTAWAQHCDTRPERECAEGYEAAGVSAESVQQCYLASFGGDVNANSNTLLAAAQAAFKQLPLYFIPAIVVGGNVMHGDFSSAALERLICSHLSVPHAKCSHYFCAPGCWPDMLSNLLCDPACNVDSCGFDSGSCRGTNPLASPTVVPIDTNNGEAGTTNNGTTTNSGGSPSTGAGQGNMNSTAGTNSTSTSSGQGSFNNTTSQSPTNSTSGTSSSPSSSNPSDEECSPGCDIDAWSSDTCVPACNNSLCSYQNWICTCAYMCTPDLLRNDICDYACNTPLCGFDNGTCSRVSLPTNFYPDTLNRDSQSEKILDAGWKKGLVISLGTVGFL